MVNLPSFLAEQSFPFQSISVDFAGPFLIKDRKGCGAKVSKCYLCLFICLARKGVHLETVSSLSSESAIFSDNGSIFMGPRPLLKEFGNVLKSGKNAIYEFAGVNEFWTLKPS